MNFADVITSSLNMEDIFLEYGFMPNRAGFITCPFHSEKTASLKMYANKQKFKCFGCNESGSVIDFVMKLYNLTYMQAVIKLNWDFNLNLPLSNRPLGIREKMKIVKANEERKERLEKRALEEYEKSNRYADLTACYLIAEKVIKNEAPADGEEWNDTFAKAVMLKALVNYELDNFNFGRR